MIKTSEVCRLWSHVRTHLAIWMKPQEAAACRGVQPSLSPRLMSLPFSTRNWTISAFSSMQAWKETCRRIIGLLYSREGLWLTSLWFIVQGKNPDISKNLLVSTKAPRTKNNDFCVYLEGLFTKWAAKSPQVLSKIVVPWPEWNSESVQQLLLRLS